MPRFPIVALSLVLACLTSTLRAQPERAAAESGIDPWIAAHRDDLTKLYTHLHLHPELSYQEVETAARIAEELRKAGASVTTGVGKLGVVGVIENGAGPVVLVRTDMDALPVTERTGLPYASTVESTRQRGPRRRRDARLRPRHSHDLLRRHGALAGGTQGPLVGHGGDDRPARRGRRRRRAEDAQGRPLHALSEARFRARLALLGDRAGRRRLLSPGSDAGELDLA